jgi:hypothetical protein
VLALDLVEEEEEEQCLPRHCDPRRHPFEETQQRGTRRRQSGTQPSAIFLLLVGHVGFLDADQVRDLSTDDFIGEEVIVRISTVAE